MRKIAVFFILLLTVFSNCKNPPKPKATDKLSLKADKIRDNRRELAEHLQNLKNVTVYSPKQQQIDTVIFQKKVVFEGSNKVHLSAFIDRFKVDSKNRVIISAFKPGSVKLYVFNPDGSFLKTLGREGKGPGEFIKFSGMQIASNKLYIFDLPLKRITVYSLENFSLYKVIPMRRKKFTNNQSIASLRADQLVDVMNNGHILMSFSNWGKRWAKNKKLFKYYYYLDEKGKIISHAILKLKEPLIYQSKKKLGPGVPLPFTEPFTRNTLIAISNQNRIYTCWSENFLIKVFGKHGNYKRAFYYPTKRSNLFLEDLDINKSRRKVLGQYKLPETWPIIHQMFFDNENRLWVFTITNNENY